MIEPIGIATVVVGLLCLAVGLRLLVPVFVAASLLGAAAAFIIGAANIQPAHLLLFFVAAALLGRPRLAADVLRALRPGEPGFWLLCLVCYGVVSAYLMPRVLAGATDIIPLGTSAYDDTGSTVPLGPVSSNLTQSVYLCANLLCFAITVAIASSPKGFRIVLSGLIAFVAGNILFALLDFGTYLTGTQDLLSFIRNARYTLHTDVEVAGMKRIVGSFTEASSFARSTLGAFGLSATLWLCGYRPWFTGPAAFASLVLLVMSTSSTGLVGAPLMLGLLYLTALTRSGVGPQARNSSYAVLVAPLAVALVALWLVLDRGTSQILLDYLNLAIFEKSTSDSGIERSAWNSFALQNFIDTWGIGVGLGTVRSSNFAIALLAGVGIPGTLFYCAFAAGALMRARGPSNALTSDVRLAARNACFGLILGDMLVSAVIDQGLFFYILAGIAAAQPERAVAAAPARQREAFA
jgi:hypothetical protein